MISVVCSACSGMVTDQQVRILRRRIGRGQTQEAAAAAAGMSVRSARQWKSGPLPSASRKPRSWRTRKDPFDEVWQSEIVPLLRTDTLGRLEATTILEHLQGRFPDRFDDGQLRSLQRRIRDWRALEGPAKEVFFEQVHEVGREAAVDFTHCDGLEVLIAGEPFEHLLFDMVLPASGRTETMIAYGESFEALVAGLDRCFQRIGGVPHVLRMDNMSAATHDLRIKRGRAVNERFQAVLDHFGLQLSLITPRRAHKNGVVEKRNDRLKRVLEQALILRGNRRFASVAEYQRFIDEVVGRRINLPNAAKFERERSALRPLPQGSLTCYTVWQPKVRRWSTIRVNSRTYSVPSRLIGHQVTVHQYHDHLDVFYAGKLVDSPQRVRGKEGHRIEYRHIIDSLVRKPGAFRRYRYRDELFPTLAFRRAYDRLRTTHGERADVEYVRILHLAARTMQTRVTAVLEDLLASAAILDYATVRERIDPPTFTVPQLSIPTPDPSVYDALLARCGGPS